jgi:23S rRNA pseudouridine1911/1915/1917 synthase
MNHSLAGRILYADSSCLVINKIPGEAVEGPGPGMGDLSALAAALTPGDFLEQAPCCLPRPVHRLDVPVSGCVLFARGSRPLAFLNQALAQGGIEKRYWAILETPAGLDGTGELVHWLREDPARNKSAAYDQPGRGRKKAILAYRVAGQGERYLFLEITLLTGRHHQIRAQLAALGLHIKGDLKYGARRSEKNGGIRLHARTLCFPDPASPERLITVTAPPPFRDRLWAAFEGCQAPFA